jgi:hypothetical protein
MRRIIVCVALALSACEVCEAEPETFNGGRQVRWYREDSGRECVEYRTTWCEYTLCQDPGLCGWSLAGWHCW